MHWCSTYPQIDVLEEVGAKMAFVMRFSTFALFGRK